jgi:5-formyltetrahydrofolate cyclo-ligase
MGEGKMQKAILESKAALRQQMRAQLRNMDPAQRTSDSARACALIKSQTVWRKAQTILFYAPLAEELDVWPLTGEALAAGKIVALLRFDSGTDEYVACRIQNPAGDMQDGKFGIREPNERCPILPVDELDLVLVPGVAFDMHGRRLGRGGGIYDRLMELASGTTCGVAFDEQIVPEIPTEAHDINVKCLLTPTRWIKAWG